VPNRLLRDGICTSDTINFLSAEAEVLFYRLLVVSDDFGHMDGRTAILKAQCFPLKESATLGAIQSWVDELASRGLIRRYSADGKLYIAVCKWEQRARTHPKYPSPDADGSQWIDSETATPDSKLLTDCGQPAVNLRTGLGLGLGKGKGRGAAKKPLPDGWVPSAKTAERLGQEFGLRVPEDIDRYVAAFRDQCKAKGYKYFDFDAAFGNCVRGDWPKFRGGKPKLVELEKRVAL